MIDLYEQVIYEFIGYRNDSFHIAKISNFNRSTQKRLDSLEGRKIYILDIDVPGKSGLDLAREIRQSHDWDSQIIIISILDDQRTLVFTNKILALDFISKTENVAKRLRETLDVAYNISTNHHFFSFQYNRPVR